MWCAVLGLVFATLPAVPAAAAAPVCQPAASRVVADVPWPQQRYDYGAIGRLADGHGITVAVLDSGVDGAHPQLRDRLTGGVDLVDGGNGRVDCVGHGTAVASVIAARPRSGSGLRGLAPGVRILPIRVTDRHDSDGEVVGSGLDAKGIAQAVHRATAARVDVINLSLSTGTDERELREAIAAAVAADIVVIAAAGNGHDQGDPIPYPAAYPGVLGVGAVDASGHRVATSQVGTYVDLVAPGERVVGAQPGGGHAELTGTSLAAPFVAATAALLRQYRPDLDAAGVVRRLLATADPAPGARPSPDYGYGVLNPLRALTEVLPAGAAPPRTTPVASPPPLVAAPAGVSMSMAVSVAAGVVSAAVLLSLVAATMSAGRRRRWRPGTLPPVPNALPTHTSPPGRSRIGGHHVG